VSLRCQSSADKHRSSVAQDELPLAAKGRLEVIDKVRCEASMNDKEVKENVRGLLFLAAW
jgi:hypothetical protein